MATKVIGLISTLKNLCDEFANAQLDIAVSHLESLKQLNTDSDDFEFEHDKIINNAFNMVDRAYNHICNNSDEGNVFDLFNQILGELDDLVMEA